jgi:glutathione S-transferase
MRDHPAMHAKLYAVAGSHPSAAAEAALTLKGVPYERVDLPPGAHVLAQRLRFGARTVPGLVLDGEKLSGSRTILHALDRAVPDPPLYPADPAALARVEAADAWGDDVLQSGVRRLAWAITPYAGRAAATLQEDARTPLKVPPAAVGLALPLLGPLERRLNDVSRERTRADLEALPGWIDHVDELIAEGVLGAEPFPNAADLQIGSSIRLLMAFDDLVPYVEGRPAAAHALRAFPRYPGRIPAGRLRN